MVKACQIVVRSMLLNKFYSEFGLVTRIKFPLFPRPNLIFYKPYMTSWNGHWCITLRRIPAIFRIKALRWMLNIIINYEEIPNQITYSFVRMKKNVQELLSKSVQAVAYKQMRCGRRHGIDWSVRFVVDWDAICTHLAYFNNMYT